LAAEPPSKRSVGLLYLFCSLLPAAAAIYVIKRNYALLGPVQRPGSYSLNFRRPKINVYVVNNSPRLLKGKKVNDPHIRT
jgi:hypothetical protein